MALRSCGVEHVLAASDFGNQALLPVLKARARDAVITLSKATSIAHQLSSDIAPPGWDDKSTLFPKLAYDKATRLRQTSKWCFKPSPSKFSAWQFSIWSGHTGKLTEFFNEAIQNPALSLKEQVRQRVTCSIDSVAKDMSLVNFYALSHALRVKADLDSLLQFDAFSTWKTTVSSIISFVDVQVPFKTFSSLVPLHTIPGAQLDIHDLAWSLRTDCWGLMFVGLCLGWLQANTAPNPGICLISPQACTVDKESVETLVNTLVEAVMKRQRSQKTAVTDLGGIWNHSGRHYTFFWMTASTIEIGDSLFNRKFGSASSKAAMARVLKSLHSRVFRAQQISCTEIDIGNQNGNDCAAHCLDEMEMRMFGSKLQHGADKLRWMTRIASVLVPTCKRY